MMDSNLVRVAKRDFSRTNTPGTNASSVPGQGQPGEEDREERSSVWVLQTCKFMYTLGVTQFKVLSSNPRM